jgi:hypothetical protein
MTGLFDGLFDDAALFPPGDAPMAVAVPAHRELRAHLGGLVGPSALRTWPADRAARARAVFTSFGTCSVFEPVDDLVGLGLLPAPERIPA